MLKVLELRQVMIYWTSAGDVAPLSPDFLRGGLSLTYWELSRDEEFFRVN